MPVIDSPQNQRLKLYRSLNTAKGRKESGLFAVEGTHGIEEMLGAGWRAEVGYWCPELLPGEDLPERLLQHSTQFLVLSRRAFEAMSEVQSPQGIAAAVPVPKRSLRGIGCGPGLVLAVHELRDPGNMGTMIRIADAAGAAAVVAVDHCVDFWMPKVVRAASGSLFHLPLLAASSAELLQWAQATGTAVAATVVKGGARCDEVEFPERTAVLVGSEAQGLPEALLTASDCQVTIPMPGRAESLNAAIAAGILLYEYNRQRSCRAKGDDGEK